MPKKPRKSQHSLEDELLALLATKSEDEISAFFRSMNVPPPVPEGYAKGFIPEPPDPTAVLKRVPTGKEIMLRSPQVSPVAGPSGVAVGALEEGGDLEAILHRIGADVDDVNMGRPGMRPSIPAFQQANFGGATAEGTAAKVGRGMFWDGLEQATPTTAVRGSIGMNAFESLEGAPGALTKTTTSAAKNVGKLGKLGGAMKWVGRIGGVLGLIALAQTLYEMGPGARKQQRADLATDELLADETGRTAMQGVMDSDMNKFLTGAGSQMGRFGDRVAFQQAKDQEDLAALAAREQGTLSQIAMRSSPSLEELMASLGVTP